MIFVRSFVVALGSFPFKKKIPPCFPEFSSRPSSGCLGPLDFGSGSRGSPGTRFCSDLDVENGKGTKTPRCHVVF